MGYTADAFNKALGERIRATRRVCALSLVDVESLSGGEFKASVVGAYERGERALSVARLAGLAELYGVEVSTLIPPEGLDGIDDDVVIDIEALESSAEGESALLDDFLAAIQQMRGASSELAVRKSDLKLLSVLLSADVANRESDHI